MKILKKISEYLLYILISLWILLPLYLITVLSFTSKDEIYKFPKQFIPKVFSFDTIKFFLSSYGTLSSFKNSIIVALISLIIVLIISLPSAYAISRFYFRGREGLKVFILTSRMLPIPLLAIPITNLYIALRLYDNLLGVAFLHSAMALPFAIIILSGIFVKISRDYEEAAYIFGAGKIKAFFKITLPLAFPGISAMLIFTFITSWNEVFAASILTVENRTLSAHVLNVLQGSPLYFKYAAGFFLSLPAILFIFFIRNYLINMWGGFQSEK